MMKFVDAAAWVTSIKTTERVNKASGRNRSRRRLHWSVRAAGAHAALLIRDGFLSAGFCWAGRNSKEEWHKWLAP